MGTRNTYREYYKSYYNIDFGADIVIHHIDFDRDNNDIKNLLAMPRALHSKYHECLNQLENSGAEIKDIKLSDRSCVTYHDLYYIEQYIDVVKEVLIWVNKKEIMDLKKEGEYNASDKSK